MDKTSPVAVPLPQDVSKLEAVPGNAAPQVLQQAATGSSTSPASPATVNEGTGEMDEDNMTEMSESDKEAETLAANADQPPVPNAKRSKIKVTKGVKVKKVGNKVHLKGAPKNNVD